MKLLTVLLVLAATTAPQPYAGTLFTQVSAEGGVSTFTPGTNWSSGSYTEPGESHVFSEDFKQGDRNSPNPVLVATITPTTSEHYQGNESLAFQIIDQTEPGTPAYKADLSLAGGHDSFDGQVTKPNDRYLGFAMKIDPTYYVLPSSSEVTFSQWHQGSPMHPPVALTIVPPAMATSLGWPASPNGRFGLSIRNDAHNAMDQLPGKELWYDLGPVQTGVWLTFVTHVRAGLTSNGIVQVWENGQQVADVTNERVGYNPANPQYQPYGVPPPHFDWISMTLYREQGDNHQRLYFDEGKFADSMTAATP